MRPWIEKHKMQNWRLDPMDQAKPGVTHGMRRMGPDLDHQAAAGRVFGLFPNRTEMFFLFYPVLLVHSPDRLLTLPKPGPLEQVYPHEQPKPFEMGWIYQQQPGICSKQFQFQFSIWVLIISQHDQWVDCAVLATLSPPTLRFAIGPIFVESLSKSHEFRFLFGLISHWLNQYQSDY